MNEIQTAGRIKLTVDRLVKSSGDSSVSSGVASRDPSPSRGQFADKKHRSRAPSLNLTGLTAGYGSQGSGDRSSGSDRSSDRLITTSPQHSPTHKIARTKYWIIDTVGGTGSVPIIIKAAGDIIEILQTYNVKTFLATTSDDLSRLADQLSALGIITDLIYVAGGNDSTPTVADRVDCFLGLMEKYSGGSGGICICAETDFIMIACFLVKILFEYAVARDHKIKIVDEMVPITRILSDSLVHKMAHDMLVRHVMGMLAHHERLSSRDEILVESYCRKAVMTAGKK